MRSLNELMSIQGRVALVTGGAGHLGAVIGDTLAELGASVVVLDRDAAAGADVSERIRRTHGVETIAMAVDLADESSVRSVPDRIVDRIGRLDILVNCAALVGTSNLDGWAVPFHQQSAHAWRLALEVNLTAPFILTQVCAPLLAASGAGAVINIGSIYGVVASDASLYEGTAMGNPAAYAASKAGLLQLTRWLATALAPRVRVNAVTAGGILRGQPATFVARYEARTPMRRMAKEDDFRGAVAYLAGDASAYVTGHNLVVDGGWTAW